MFQTFASRLSSSKEAIKQRVVLLSGVLLIFIDNDISRFFFIKLQVKRNSNSIRYLTESEICFFYINDVPAVFFFNWKYNLFAKIG